MAQTQPQASNEQAKGASSPSAITFDSLKADAEILTLIEAADAYLGTIGITDHGLGHVSRVGIRARGLLKALNADVRECELAAIAGLMHDIGNAVHREGHAHHSAHLCFQLLKERGMPTAEIATVMSAVANHDESNGEPVSNASAALNIADKSDVLRSRVRNPHLINFDIHDRVNYAAKQSELITDKDHHLITLHLEIDTQISQVMEYFEIFMSRMGMCRRAANFLNCDFQLVINDVRVM
jgi:hypothetical protein